MSVPQSQRRVLIVDDEATIRNSLSLLLKRHFEVTTAEDGAQALAAVEASPPDIILLDMVMPGIDGIETLKSLRARDHKMPVIMLTGINTVKSAVEAMKAGAVDYIGKPFDIEELTSVITNTLDLKVQSEHSPTIELIPTPDESTPGDFGPLVGRSAQMSGVFKQIEQISHHDATVLITGESGTGKELIARQVHALSKRRNEAFVAINCAAIPESLIESELFGHERGAFTHAVERRLGHFELADRGTLFLDEIGELSLPVQVKMLRFLQEQEFYRVGRSKPIRVDVRIVAATNRDLEELIREKRFRSDLYYRINVINVALPPLRDRFEDIRYLIDHFVQKFSPVYSNRMLTFDEGALNRLVEYPWPGNVRELENVVEALMALSLDGKVTEEMLPPKIRSHQGMDMLRPPPASVTGNLKFEDAERVFETEMIMKALRKSNYVQTRAAELLGVSRRILKYKMDKLGISDKPVETEPH